MSMVYYTINLVDLAVVIHQQEAADPSLMEWSWGSQYLCGEENLVRRALSFLGINISCSINYTFPLLIWCNFFSFLDSSTYHSTLEKNIRWEISAELSLDTFFLLVSQIYSFALFPVSSLSVLTSLLSSATISLVKGSLLIHLTFLISGRLSWNVNRYQKIPLSISL